MRAKLLRQLVDGMALPFDYYRREVSEALTFIETVLQHSPVGSAPSALIPFICNIHAKLGVLGKPVASMGR
jgi:hypothetical protein